MDIKEELIKLKKKRRNTIIIGFCITPLGYAILLFCFTFAPALGMIGMLIAVAGIGLIMRGLMHVKYRGLNKALKEYQVSSSQQNFSKNRLSQKESSKVFIFPPETNFAERLKETNDCSEIKFDGFGFWIGSVSQVKKLLFYMAKAVDVAKKQGYTIGKVQVFGGVHELDTGYESFSNKTYPNFEDALEQLPIDFAEEAAKLDGQWFNTLNFEFLTVELFKDKKSYSLIFNRGKLKAPEELIKFYLSVNWYEA